MAEQAKPIAAAAIAEARKNQWTMAIAIVDIAGDLVYFERMDHTQVGSVDIAQAKARSAARFKRPTKAFQDALAAGGEGWRILSLEGAVAVEGGIPLMSGGKIVGAIGASGGTESAGRHDGRRGSSNAEMKRRASYWTGSHETQRPRRRCPGVIERRRGRSDRHEERRVADIRR